MRFCAKTLVLVIFLWAAAAPVSAQTLPFGLSVDSSLRIEYMLGAQSVRQVGLPAGQAGLPDDPKFAFERFRFKFDPKLPILSGTVEASPLPWLSGRFAGSLSLWEPNIQVYRSFNIAGTSWAANWEAKPQFNSWEAAGLLHFWNAGGYRFSATAGYRRRNWKYIGKLLPDSSDDTETGSPYREVLISHIPFLGLQTAMYFPLWKARFEILGSAFMNKIASSSFTDGTNLVRYRTSATRGGFLECQIEGTVGVAANVFCGVFGRFGYEDLFGRFDVTTDTTGPDGMEANLRESFAVLGLDLTLFF